MGRLVRARRTRGRARRPGRDRGRARTPGGRPSRAARWPRARILAARTARSAAAAATEARRAASRRRSCALPRSVRVAGGARRRPPAGDDAMGLGPPPDRADAPPDAPVEPVRGQSRPDARGICRWRRTSDGRAHGRSGS